MLKKILIFFLLMCKLALFVVRIPIYIIKYFFKGVIYLSVDIYESLKMIIKMIIFNLGIVFKYSFLGFLFIANLIFKIIKYDFKCIAIPLILIKMLWIKGEPKRIEKRKKREKIKLEKLEKKNAKKLEIRNKKKQQRENKRLALEEKNRLKQQKYIEKLKDKENAKNKVVESKSKRKKEDEYINDEVKIEKTNPFIDFTKNIKAGFANFGASIVNKFTNNNFAKNIKNKRDMNRHALLIDFEGEDAKKSEKKVVYKYVAKNKDGKVVTDFFEAFSKVEVHSYLLSEGYEVYSIKTNSFIQLMHKSTGNRTRFKNKDLIFMLTQLSTYIKAGIPLVDAIRILSRQYKKKAYKKIFQSLIYELTTGENLSDAMEKQNVAFPKLLINMVKTAEMTGELPEVLDDMAEYYTEVDKTRKQMITAMMYPAIVFLLSIAVMIFIMIYVVPQFVEIYATMDGVKLPLITQVILAISDFMQTYWYILIAIVIFIIVLFVLSYKKLRTFRTIVQWVVMRTPVFGITVIYNEVTMFTKTFASLLSHNVPITDSMEVLNKITNNEIFKMLILDTISNLARGGKISDAFKDNWAFPVPAYEMIVTGETTGELAEMMKKVSEYYQELHKNAVTRIKTFIEPFITIFLAVGVGIIILSIIIPMFDMYSSVSELG